MPALSIGMATYNDFDATAFTLQSLRMYHSDAMRDCELIVVDNAPDGRAGERLQDLCKKIKARYIHAPEPQGTAAPRQRVFDEATADAVLCLDAHVLLAPDSLTRLIRWFADNPERPYLVTGPLVYDPLNNGEPLAPAKPGSMETQFDPVWGGGMYGRWGFNPRATEIDGRPFGIEMMGLGIFACRKSAWPGFNPRFRGFGGEEGYIHEKIRRAGGANICLPFLRWWHRFGDAGKTGMAYPLLVEDKVWNYCVGWTELGWDLEPVRQHFTAPENTGNRIPGYKFDQIAQAAIRGDAEPPHRAEKRKTTTITKKPGGCSSCGGGKTAIVTQPASGFAIHAGKLKPFVERIGREGVVYEHSASDSPAGSVLAGLHPGKVVIFAQQHCKATFAAHKAREGRDIEIQAGTDSAPRQAADLIALTGYSDGRRLLECLRAAGDLAARFIVVSGTNTADTGAAPGPFSAIREYLRNEPRWSVLLRDRNGEGLTVLGCLAEDKPTLPPLKEEGKNFLWAVARTAKAYVSGDKVKADPELIEARLAVCAGCEHRNNDRCSRCGCFLAAKSALQGEACPEALWPAAAEGQPLVAFPAAEITAADALLSDLKHSNHVVDADGLLIADTGNRPVIAHAPGRLTMGEPIWQRITEYADRITPTLKPCEELTVILCHNRPAPTPIERQLQAIGQRHVVLRPEEGAAWNNRLKLSLIRDWLHSQDHDTGYVMHVDADDALLLRSPGDAVMALEANLVCEMLVGAEQFAYPSEPERRGAVRQEMRIAADLGPEALARPHLNSGVWIGRNGLPAIFDALLEADTHAISDQAAFREIHNGLHPRIRLDYECELVANLNVRRTPTGARLRGNVSIEDRSGLALVVLNWKRPKTVAEIVERYHSYPSIAEIIVWDNSGTFPAERFPWVRTVTPSEPCSLDTRFHGALLANTHAVLFHDDDLILSESAVETLYQHWKDQPESVHGIFGRQTRGRDYEPKDAFGAVDVVLTRAAICSRYLAADVLHEADQFRDLRLFGPGNGEDLLLSYVATHRSGRLNVAHDLRGEIVRDDNRDPASRAVAISATPGHQDLRTLICRRAESLFPANLQADGKAA